MAERTTIDGCIATFRRPAMLAGLLSSLEAQDLSRIRMRIVVIDNDRDATARDAVEAFRARSPFEVVYDVAPQQNIALARNRAIMHAKSEYLAFIDDDESACDTWLESLLSSLIKYDADVAFGPVNRVLPNDAPAWAAECFHMPPRRTGELMQYGGAGNVMLRRGAIENPHFRFNAAFGLTGGEDTDFFYRLHLAGRRLIWCEQAHVSEPVPETRLTLQGIRRRGFRGGQTYNRIFVSRYSSLGKVVWFAYKALQLIGGVVSAPFIRLISYRSYVVLTVRIAAASGQLSCCFSGENFEEYSIRRYQ
jgi:succinoglycan biosynthesis protein ExoM